MDALRKDIEPYEVRQVLEATVRWPRPATTDTGKRVLSIWARTRAGRPLIVTTYHHDGLIWKIIGASEMNFTQLAEFEAWEELRHDQP